MTQRVVMFSGGAGSWAAARRVLDHHGTDGMVLLFADTRTEDADLYRFLGDAAADIGVPLTTIADGRDIWGVFFDERMMGSSQRDPCSKILKRKPMRAWLEQHCDPSDTVIYLGIDWTEAHRLTRAARHWVPWAVEAPMCEPPYVEKGEMIAALRQRGIAPPRLYDWGMPHNNCGGFCVKAGHAQFARLLQVAPDRYTYHEQREQEFRERHGKDVAIMRDRSGGVATPLTMTDFRLRIERAQEGTPIDWLDWGGCACLEEPEEGQAP